MKPYREMSKEELLALKAELDAKYSEAKALDLHLDMSRGKPSAEQLDLSMGMMDVLDSFTDLKCEAGIDCRNYGYLDGLPEVRQLLADMLEVGKDEIIVGGNSSLNMMYDAVA